MNNSIMDIRNVKIKDEPYSKQSFFIVITAKYYDDLYIVNELYIDSGEFHVQSFKNENFSPDYEHVRNICLHSFLNQDDAIKFESDIINSKEK